MRNGSAPQRLPWADEQQEARTRGDEFAEDEVMADTVSGHRPRYQHQLLVCEGADADFAEIAAIGYEQPSRGATATPET